MQEPPEWLREFRDPLPEWEPPDELKVPTVSPPINLALSMLVSDLIGNDVVEVIGLWIAAMARLNMWYMGTVKTRLPRGTRPQLLVLPGKVAERIYQSWSAYKTAIGDPPKGDADSEYEDLMRAIREGIDSINDFMSTNTL